MVPDRDTSVDPGGADSVDRPGVARDRRPTPFQIGEKHVATGEERHAMFWIGDVPARKAVWQPNISYLAQGMPLPRSGDDPIAGPQALRRRTQTHRDANRRH